MDNYVKRLLSKDCRIISLPSKYEKKKIIYSYLSEKFDYGTKYSEQDVNHIITENIEFDNYILVRKEMCDFGFLKRTPEGKFYWKEERTDNIG